MGIVGQLFFQIFIICNSSFKNEVWCRQRATFLPRLFLNSFLYKISYIFLILFESNMFSDDKTNMCFDLMRKPIFVFILGTKLYTQLSKHKHEVIKNLIFLFKKRNIQRSNHNILYSACKYTQIISMVDFNVYIAIYIIYNIMYGI